MNGNNYIRIFVAMPGTDMGPNATYKNPESVKANLLKPVADKLKERLGCDIELIIEKDKREAGVIHASMFAEALNADIYIADLTGANPNVYLELGVRWALRDKVTVPIAQSVEDLKFNVFANRVILYYPDIIVKATEDIVAAIENGLNKNYCDSPVRINGEFLVIIRSELERLHAEVKRLTNARGEDLLRAAKAANNASDRLPILKQAVDINPASIPARLELGLAYRDLGQYDKAEDAFKNAIRLDPNNAVVHRELGVCYSKQKMAKLATDCLREAVRLSPSDAEAWSNLGGALRRLGMVGGPQTYDKKALEDARESYSQAHKLDRYDLYSGLNVARLDIMLSKWDIARSDQAKEGFRKQVHLCRYAVEEKPEDYWRRFDLGDALLFSGHYSEAQKAFTEAIQLIPTPERRDKISSVLGPLRDYLVADVVDGLLKVTVEKIISELEASIV